MTEYTDVPRANALYTEQELVLRAIDIVDSQGTLSMFTVTPPPLVPTDPPSPPPTNYQMPANVSTAGSEVTPEFLAQVRAWLVQRSADIDAELAAIGVTDQPARRV